MLARMERLLGPGTSSMLSMWVVPMVVVRNWARKVALPWGAFSFLACLEEGGSIGLTTSSVRTEGFGIEMKARKLSVPLRTISEEITFIPAKELKPR